MVYRDVLIKTSVGIAMQLLHVAIYNYYTGIVFCVQISLNISDRVSFQSHIVWCFYLV